MTTVVGVDLAAVRSGVCRLEDGVPTSHWTSARMGVHNFLDLLLQEWEGADAVVIEDVPPSVAWQRLSKAVYRLQGRIVERHEYQLRCGLPTPVVAFVAPQKWQRHWGVFGEGKWAAVDKAEALGWCRPVKLNKKDTQDLADSYLLARWAEEMLTEHGSFDDVGVEVLTDAG